MGLEREDIMHVINFNSRGVYSVTMLHTLKSNLEEGRYNNAILQEENNKWP